MDEAKGITEEANPEATELAKELDAYQSKVVRFLSLAIILFALVLCLVVIGYVNVSGTARNLDSTTEPESEYQEQEVDENFNPLYEPTHSMPLPFGVKARNQCLLRCFAPNVEKMLCAKGCDKLASSDYAHLVRSVDLDPAALGKKIANDCQEKYAKPEKTVPRVEWFEFIRAADKFVRETKPQIDLYRKIRVVSHFTSAEALQKNLLFPEGDNPLDLQVNSRFLSVLCLRQSIASTQLAVIEAASAGDVFGEKFYRKVEDGLLEIARPLDEEAGALFLKLEARSTTASEGDAVKRGGGK